MLFHRVSAFWSSIHTDEILLGNRMTGPSRGAISSSFRVWAIFMKFHSMTLSCLFNRGTTFSHTVAYNNNVFLPADTKSIVQTHTFCTTLVDENRQNRTFCNSVGGWITSVKRNFWLHAICACTEQHSAYQIRW